MDAELRTESGIVVGSDEGVNGVAEKHIVVMDGMGAMASSINVLREWPI